MASFTKTPEFIKFKKVQDDFLSDYTAGEAAKIRQVFTEQCLSPLGYTNQAVFCFDKKLPEEDKLSHIADWTELWESGKFAPAGKPAPKKKKASKRGASLDAIKLDDSKPDVVHNPEKLEAVTEQPKPVTKQPAIIDTVDAMQKHKEEKDMPNISPEDAIKVLLNNKGEGISEENVLRIVTEVIKEVINAVADTACKRCDTILNDYKEND
jgi:hypothetical protein